MAGIIQAKLQSIAIRDRAIHSRFEKKRNRIYRRYGVIIRRAIRNKLRRKGGKTGRKSKPGEPPRTQVPEPNFRSVLYGFTKNALVAGPIGFGSKSSQDDGPQLAENGGYFRNRATGRRSFYAARPFVGPAFESTNDELQEAVKQVGLL